MPVRITGLNSGLDTDSIVQELVKSYSGQKESIVKKQTKLQWKQDAWKELNTKIYSFYSSQLSNMRYASAYQSKTTTSTDESKVKVSTSKDATVGTQSIEVKQLAQAAYLTSSTLKTKSGDKVDNNTRLGALGVDGLQKMEVEVDGKTKTINVSADETVKDFIDNLKEIGLNASFDKTTQRFFINSNESGSAANFKFVSDDVTMLTGAALSLGDGSMVTVGTKLSDLGITEPVSFKVIVNGKEETISLDPRDLSNGEDDAESGDRIYHLVEKLKGLGLDASFNQQGQRLVISKESGNASDFKIVADDNSREALSKLGLLDEEQGGTASYYSRKVTDTLSALGLLDDKHGGSATKVDGQDAIIKLNGAEFTSSDNMFSINGLEITATGVTAAGSSVTLTTSTDTKGIYDSIKKFFKEYNELIKEMDTLYNADSSKGYEPLTDDEKDEMSDKEIEKWEKKIKDSLLRRDSTLGSVSEVMRSALARSYTINGKTYSLSSFGIGTQSYLSAGKNEKNLYHIDGDEDDALTKSVSDKLMKALTEDPDSVAEFFSQLVKGTYEALDKKMKSTSLSSAYVVYNDKQITSDLKQYDSKINKWEDKVKYYEDFYYKKFSGMEKALAELQSSQNSLSMLLGQ